MYGYKALALAQRQTNKIKMTTSLSIVYIKFEQKDSVRRLLSQRNAAHAVESNIKRLRSHYVRS